MACMNGARHNIRLQLCWLPGRVACAQGALSAEVQAAQAAAAVLGTAPQPLTAYVNLEPGDCHGEDAALRALVSVGVARVVVGLRHPLPHARGVAIKALRSAGIVVGESQRLCVPYASVC
jgi:pyrimidine deaminase RibD-like protein